MTISVINASNAMAETPQITLNPYWVPNRLHLQPLVSPVAIQIKALQALLESKYKYNLK